MVDVALRFYILTPASEPNLTNPDEIQEAIRSLQVSKAPDPNSIQNRALKHLPQRSVSLLAQIFNAGLLTHHFLTVWKHARVIAIFKPRKDPTLHHIGPLVSWTRLVNYLKRSYWLGSYMK
jgi:hypothetical protein